MAYSQDLSERVLLACDRGMPTKKIADVFDVSPAWVRRLKQRRRETGETSPRPSGGARVRKIDMNRLAGLVNEQPDATAKDWNPELQAFVYLAHDEPEKQQGFTHKNARKKKERVVFVADPELAPIDTIANSYGRIPRSSGGIDITV